MAKVQNEMATKISLDTVTATNSLKGLTSAVSAATSSFKANSAMLASAGDMVGSYSEKVSGLSKAMELQQSKIDALRSRQEGLDVTTQSGAEQYQKLEKQIATATRQMASMESQQERAKSSLGYYTSGLADLQRGYETAQKASQAYVSRLEAEGKQDEANQARMSGLKQSLSNLSSQYEKQESELQKIASTSGVTSEAYLKQKTRLDETGTAVAETNSKISKLNSEMKTAPTGFFAKLKSGFSQTGEEAEETGKKVHIGLGVFIGNTITNGINQATSSVKEFAVQGFESAEAAQEVAEKWKNMGASKTDIKAMGASVKSLKENTNLSGTAVANLTTKFYDMTGSASKTNQLAQGVGSLSDKLKLSNTQADGFANGLSKIEASGTVTSSSLGRIEKQAPGLGTALQQASGMSKEAFDSLVSSGKMTSTQFNDILQKASKDYKENSAEFDSSSQGALKHIQQSWADTKQALMTPLVNVAATGLSSLSKALEAPAMQNAIKQLGNGIASLGTKLAGILTYVSAHEKDISSITGSVLSIAKAFALGIWNTFKDTLSGISKVFNDLTGNSKKAKDPLNSVSGMLKTIASHKGAIQALGTVFIATFTSTKIFNGIKSLETGLAGLTKSLGFTSTAEKILNASMKANIFILVASAIATVVVALVELYKHNKKFRDFVNGIIKAAQDCWKNVVKYFKALWKDTVGIVTSLYKDVTGWFSNLGKGISSSVSNMWKSTKNGFKDGWNTVSSWTGSSVKWLGNKWNDMKSDVGNKSSDMWKNTKNTFHDGWNTVSNWTGSSVKWLSDKWNDMHNATISTAKDMWKNQKGTFEDGYKVTQDYTQTWHDIMTGKWSKVSSDLKNTANDLTRFWRDLFEGVYDWLNNITGGRLGDMLNTFKSIFGTIQSVISGAVRGVRHGFIDIVDAILSPFNDMLSGLEKGINWVLDKVGASTIKGTWRVDVPTYAKGTQGGVLHDQLAMVNDAKGANYREMYHTPDGQVGMFPAQRNMIVPLKAGTEILDGNSSARLANLMGLQKYASGSIGSFFSGIFNKGKDLLEDADKIIAHPVEFLESVFSKFAGGIKASAGLANDIMTNFPVTVAKNAISWIKNLFSEDAGGGKGAPSGSGVQRWGGQVKDALKANGLSTSESMVNRVLRQIVTESTGNPNAKQSGSDPDGDGSGPAMGLMQTKQGTFRANAFPGHGDIFNGYDNLLAALHYAKARYGSSLSFLGNGHGYANGGIVSTEGLYTLAEGNKPEFVIPTDYTKHNRAVELLNQAKTAITGTGLDNGTSKKLDTLIEQNSALISLVKAMLTKKMDVNFNGKLVGELYPEFDKQGYVSNYYQQRNVWG